MEILTVYNIIIIIINVVAFISNLCSFLYITQTFDIKQSFFHILCLDALVVISSTLISLLLFSITLSGEGSDEITCSFLIYGSQITVLTSPLCNFMVSFIR